MKTKFTFIIPVVTSFILACTSIPARSAEEASPPASGTASLNPIGTMGKGERVLKGDKEVVLFEHQGKGCLSHFWFGGNFEGAENTRIRYYVDGEKVPSIDMELYLGHGIGFGDNQAPWATKHIGKIGKRNGIYNNYRIPFGKSIRVTAQRAPGAEENKPIWWIIRGIENGRVSLGGVELPEDARLKLMRLENYEAGSLEEFDLCKTAGKGALYQVTIAAQGKSLTYLEACMRAYLGSNQVPLMLSSGLEDYFLGTYYFDTGKFHADIAGLTHFDRKSKSFSAYRFHDNDPVFFTDGLRLTCRCGETEHGDTDGKKGYLNPLKTRYTTYTWVYQW
jgi:hypothetical protein